MIKSSYHEWPLGIETRWLSKCPWERTHRVYASGELRSLPSEGSHLVVSLNDEYPESKVPVLRWDCMPKDASQDVIVAYDVVDHLPTVSDIGGFLSDCRDSLSDDGVLYLFCHPYKSRLGNHLFDRNMAYIHLIRGIEGEHTLRIDDPLGFYRGTIKKARMKVKVEKVYKEPIEAFFNRFSLDPDCEVQFVEYLMNR